MHIRQFAHKQLNGYGTVQEIAQQIAIVKAKDVTLTMAVPNNISKEKGRHWLYTMFETNKPPKEWGSLIRAYDRVMVPNKWNKKVFDERYKINTEIVPFGIHPEWFIYKPIKRKRPNNTFFFLMQEAFNMRKGFEYAIEAFYKYIYGKYNAELVLRSQYKQPIIKDYERQGTSILYGDIERKEQREIMLISHCLIFPSKGEGFGMTPIEAMSTGMPVIVSNLQVHKEHNLPYLFCKTNGIYKPTYGIYNDVGSWKSIDIDNLGCKMVEIIKNYEQFAYMALKARKNIEKRFNLLNNWKKWM